AEDADPAAGEEHLVGPALPIERDEYLPRPDLGPRRNLEDRTSGDSGKRTVVGRRCLKGSARDEEHVARGRLDHATFFVEEDRIEGAFRLGLSQRDRLRAAGDRFDLTHRAGHAPDGGRDMQPRWPRSLWEG